MTFIHKFLSECIQTQHRKYQHIFRRIRECTQIHITLYSPPSFLCCCILISHLSTVPVSAALVLSVKGHSGPPSRAHTFSWEINGLSLQSQPLCSFVICWHWLIGCLRKGKRTLGYVWRAATDGHSSVLCGWIRKLEGASMVLSFSETHGQWKEQVEQLELSQNLFLCVQIL